MLPGDHLCTSVIPHCGQNTPGVHCPRRRGCRRSVSERHQAAREGYFAGVVLDPPATRAALKKLTAPVLLYAGELDPMVTPAVVRAAAPVFSDATVVVQPGASHFPWVDGPAAFAAAVGSFLG